MTPERTPGSSWGNNEVKWILRNIGPLTHKQTLTRTSYVDGNMSWHYSFRVSPIQKAHTGLNCEYSKAKFMAVLAAVKWFCSENIFCTIGQTICLALGQIFNLPPILDKLLLMFGLTHHKIHMMAYYLFPVSLMAQQSNKEYVRKVITYSALSYFRQLPHVVRCWLESVAVCADKASFILRELAFIDSFFVGHQL